MGAASPGLQAPKVSVAVIVAVVAVIIAMIAVALFVRVDVVGVLHFPARGARLRTLGQQQPEFLEQDGLLGDDHLQHLCDRLLEGDQLVRCEGGDGHLRHGLGLLSLGVDDVGKRQLLESDGLQHVLLPAR